MTLHRTTTRVLCHRLILFMSLCLAILPCVSVADVLLVPEEHPTIKAGIQAAIEGDTVSVAPGVYVEQLLHVTTAVTLISRGGPALTTITPNDPLIASLRVQNAAATPCIIEGFTFNNTLSQSIQVIAGPATIQDCVFEDNGGPDVCIRVEATGNALIRYCFFYGNEGISCVGLYNGTARIYNNTFDSNRRGFFRIGGTGFARNNIVSNSTQYGIYGSFAELDYNDVWFNNPNYTNGASPGPNSISADPLYTDPGSGEYSLQPTSPCIDAGDPSPEFLDPDGTRSDMGAYRSFFAKPHPFGIVVDGEERFNVLNHVPRFTWGIQSETSVQTGYEIEIGIDADWSSAEMWASGEVLTSDQFADYNGATLVDGVYYQGRLRINDGIIWGPWIAFVFRMNSIPSIPAHLFPLADAEIRGESVSLIAEPSIDGEGDQVEYDFEVYTDAALGNLEQIFEGISEVQGLVNSPVLNPISIGNERWWRVRSSDGYETSEWSVATRFEIRGPGIITVPTDIPTIDDAVSTAGSNDTILVLPGTYPARLLFGGKLLYLKSSAGPEVTTITPRFSSTPIIEFNTPQPPGTRISGFTFKPGSTYALLIGSSSHVILDSNIITGYSSNDVPVRLNSGNLTAFNNIFHHNQGISCIGHYSGIATIYNNTFNANARGFFNLNADVVARNNLITNSTAYGIFGSFDALEYNNSYNNNPNFTNGASLGATNISADPLYSNPNNNVYNLTEFSPCVDAGDPSVQYNDADGTRNDIGAVHFPQSLPLGWNFTILNEDPTHVVNNLVTFVWSFLDDGGTQTALEIQVGTDTDWSVAERWSSGEVITSDTTIQYGGQLQLQNGAYYFARIRVRDNDLNWGSWRSVNFRLNTPPPVPSPTWPVEIALPASNVRLFVETDTDAESDAITFDFELYSHPGISQLLYDTSGVTATPDSTGTERIPGLDAPTTNSWRARSFDGFEYSAWSAPVEFDVRVPGKLFVPSEYPTIQTAVNVAGGNDTIRVDAGRYIENVYINNKSLTIIGEPGCVLEKQTDGGIPLTWDTDSSLTGSISHFYIRSGYDRCMRITENCAITVDNCTFDRLDPDLGGGIECFGDNSVIKNSLFEFCRNINNGGAILVTANDVLVDRCEFRFCRTNDGGSAVAIVNSDQVDVKRSIFLANNANDNIGGALYVQSSSNLELLNNTLAYNHTSGSASGAGITLIAASSVVVKNNIVAFSTSGSGIHASTSSTGITVTYNNVFSNATGNYSNVSAGFGSISVNPRFADISNYDVTLSPNSHCVDAADPNPIFNDPDGTRGDIGAVYSPRTLPVVDDIALLGDTKLHVVSPNPVFSWSFIQGAQPPTGVEIHLTLDTSYTSAVWLYSNSSFGDTSIVYSGNPLFDGVRYYFRIRLRSAEGWGSWIEDSIRMNSLPLTPQNSDPAPSEVLSTVSVQLKARTTLDPEDDPLTYIFSLSFQSDFSSTVFDSIGVISINDTIATSEALTGLLIDTVYWWRVRAFDGYEHSNWSFATQFRTRGPGIVRVPIDAPTIQAGIDEAQELDTVLVADGSYVENLRIDSKTIVVLAENTSTRAKLEPSNRNQTTLNITGPTQTGTEFSGFEVTGGGQTITVQISSQSKVTISNNVFHHNIFGVTNPLTVIRSNGTALISHNLFYSNGGINTIWSTAATTIVNNTIAYNERGILAQGNQTVARNNIVSSNNGYGILGTYAVNEYNNAWMNGTDNTPGGGGISQDPLFVNVGNTDFRIRPLSPCINAGNPAPEYNDPNGSRNDIGYYSFTNHTPSAVSLIAPLNVAIQSSVPTFQWTSSFDPDAGDEVRYRLSLAIDSNFIFSNVTDSITDTTFTFGGSVPFSGLIYWRVSARDLRGAMAVSSFGTFSTNLAGDANGSGQVNIADVTFLINAIFNSGPVPNPLYLGDVDHSCTVNIADVTYLIAYIFSDGPAPILGCE